MRGKNICLLMMAASLALPILSYAWQLGTRVGSGGGILQVRDLTPQTSANGTVFKFYTTHQHVQVRLSANLGFKVSSYSINSSTAIVPAAPLTDFTYQMGLVAFPDINSQTIFITYIPWMTSMTVNSGDSGGSVSPYGTSNQQYSTNKSYTFTPKTGNRVVAIEGLPASGYTLSPATIPASIDTPVVLTLTIPTTPLTIKGFFLGVVANAGPTQAVPVGSTVTLDGSGSSIKAGGGTLSYKWEQTGGTAVELSSPYVAKPTFTASGTNTYYFKLTVENGTYEHTANTHVTATNSAAGTARATCQNCHQSVGVGSNHNVFNNWSSSAHKNQFVMCAACHVGADSGGHPGQLNFGKVNGTTFTYTTGGANFCFTCHHKGNNLHYNTESEVANICVACHNPNVHNPAATMSTPLGAQHFNGYTSSVNPDFRAAYVTPDTKCSYCHITTAEMPNASDLSLLQQRLDWAGSGHADTNGQSWLAYDFKTLSGCVQCHTTQGFIAYSSARMTAAWGTDSTTREVLSCNGCHTDISSGQLRTSVPIQPYANDSYTNPNLGNTSNLCLKCHSGRQGGRSIKTQAAAGADFTNLTFTSSHYLAAGGILFKSIGYEFAGKDYRNKWHFKHDRIGINHYTAYGYDTGSDGPCVGCHMNSPNGHSFSPLTKDEAGAVTAISSPSCAGCHTGPTYLDGGRMNNRRVKYAAALLSLQQVLEMRGIYYAEVAPYFFKSSGNSAPGNAVTNWGNADTMGAAFNLNLLRHEPGAYAHNMIYAKRLIYDSIDYLDNNALDNSVSASINGLSNLNASQRATATGYLAANGTRP